jgi:hypothetical protein
MHSLTLDKRENVSEFERALAVAEPGASIRLSYPPAAVNCAFPVSTMGWPDACVLDKADRTHAVIPFQPYQPTDTIEVVKFSLFNKIHSMSLLVDFVTATFALTYHKAQGSTMQLLILDLCGSRLSLAMLYVALTRAVTAAGIWRLAGDIQHVYKLQRDPEVMQYLASLRLLSASEAAAIVGQPLEGLRVFDEDLSKAFVRKMSDKKSAPGSSAKQGRAASLGARKGAVSTSQISQGGRMPSLGRGGARKPAAVQLRVPTPIVPHGALAPVAVLRAVAPVNTGVMLQPPALVNYGLTCFSNAGLQALLAWLQCHPSGTVFLAAAGKAELEAACAERLRRFPALQAAASAAHIDVRARAISDLLSQRTRVAGMSRCASLFFALAANVMGGADAAASHRAVVQGGWSKDSLMRLLFGSADGSIAAEVARQECAAEYVDAALTAMTLAMNGGARLALSEPYVTPAAVMGPVNQPAAVTCAAVSAALEALRRAEDGSCGSSFQSAVCQDIAECFTCFGCNEQRLVIAQSSMLRLSLQTRVDGESLQSMFDSEYMASDLLPESYRCGSCGSVGVERHTFVARTAPLLCLQLGRFSHVAGQDIVVKVHCAVSGSERLWVGGHALSPALPREYGLVASVTHHGDSIDAGHYTATVCTDAGWFVCDDSPGAGAELVEGPMAIDSDAMIAEHQLAYLLFYAAKTSAAAAALVHEELDDEEM